MKKLFVILSFSCVVISCGGNDSNDSKENSKEEAKQGAAAPAAKSADYQKGLELVAQSDCFTCHDVSQKKIGPAYKDVAAKYQMSDEVVENLAGKVIKGGAGVWGPIAMTPHPQLSNDDAKTMVKYILALKK
ncbi:c-type cytochrome [Segetibacter sp.]|jgi:cytochrome c|uniref:c-type cytochrome n=1 Tax=Segetibacter sp. TaxID=2231182 RepID=UPI00262D1DAC|nr:c-type cytochrome [Segetibacter sp.]MCW3082082.1 cytochrome c class [Segetibacter sp.]